MVIHAARTGNDIIKRIDVTKIDQQNIDMPKVEKFKLKLEPLKIEVTKFIEDSKEERPKACNEKISKSIDEKLKTDNGTYKVQPEFTPPSITNAAIKINRAKTEIHSDNAFNRGNIISEVDNINGNRRFPNPPIKTGIMK
jgi:hypothetical protein